MKKIEFIDLPSEETPINAKNLNEMQDNIEQAIAVEGVAGDTLPIGTVVEFASDAVIPENWLLCNGQEVSRTEYNLLFAIIGTTWGEGDGSTTFNVPTKEGLVTVGKTLDDGDFNFLGKIGGEKTHTLTSDEMPSHSHYYNSDRGAIRVYNGNGTLKFPQDGSYANTAEDRISTTMAGGGNPHNILQPYVTSNFIIKARQSAGVVANVVNGLNSNSATDALSAKQGKILNEKISTHYVTTNAPDLNDYVVEGKYYFSSSYTPTNIPAGINGWLEVITHNGVVVKQLWYRLGTANSNDFNTYIRTRFDSGVWSDWRRLLVEDDLYYKAGDTFSPSMLACLGHLTNSKKEVIFNIITDKRLDKISTITANELVVTVRHADGGYVLDNTDIAGSDLRVSKSTNNTIRVVYNTGSTFTNNCPISVDIRSGVIKFS